MAKPHSRRVRNAVASLVLVVVLGALLIELRARRGHAAASDAVDRLMASHHHHALPRSEVEVVIGREPVGPLIHIGFEREATYSWRGLRLHVLKVYYAEAQDGSNSIVRIESN